MPHTLEFGLLTPDSTAWISRVESEGALTELRVVSAIDRYLEHAPNFYFHNNGKAEYLLSSADWMRRNFDHRIEIAFPVLDEQRQAKLKAILTTQLVDSSKCWRLQNDGHSVRIHSGKTPHLRSQEQLYELMRYEHRGANRHGAARFA